MTLSIRPESLSLGNSVPYDWNRFPATIERITFRGAERHLDLQGPGDWPIMARVLQCHRPSLRVGQSLTLSVPPGSVTLLPGKFALRDDS
ncbi:MAG: TOBE domain-containing protein [Planctomycetaceae bacterium]|nr:TOBE domain-containing protein [Planctomycetaceae bacterium]